MHGRIHALILVVILCWTGVAVAAAPTRICTSSGGSSVFSPQTVALCGSTVNNDLVIVLYCECEASTDTLTPPSGYTQLGTNATSTGASTACGIFYHLWKTGDPTSLSFADSGVTQADRVYLTESIGGQNTTTPFDPNTTPSQGSTATTSVTLTAVSPTGTTDYLSSLWFQYTSGGGTPTPTYTSPLAQYATFQIATAWESIFGADATLSASGSTGNKTFTSAGSSDTLGFMIAVQPPSAGPAGQAGWIFSQ